MTTEAKSLEKRLQEGSDVSAVVRKKAGNLSLTVVALIPKISYGGR
jgi:hypothetical protein